MFTILFILLNLLSVIFINYFNLFYLQKNINYLEKRLNEKMVLLGNSCFYFLLLIFSTNPRNIFLILMGYLLAIIDIYTYKVDSYISYLFLFTLFYLQQVTLHTLLFSFITLLVLGLLCYLMPNQLGGGDIKLLVYWSISLSPIQLAWLLFIASFTGICFILLTNLFTQTTLTKIAFVPFLAITLPIVLWWY